MYNMQIHIYRDTIYHVDTTNLVQHDLRRSIQLGSQAWHLHLRPTFSPAEKLLGKMQYTTISWSIFFATKKERYQ